MNKRIRRGYNYLNFECGIGTKGYTEANFLGLFVLLLAGLSMISITYYLDNILVGVIGGIITAVVTYLVICFLYGQTPLIGEGVK